MVVAVVAVVVVVVVVLVAGMVYVLRGSPYQAGSAPKSRRPRAGRPAAGRTAAIPSVTDVKLVMVHVDTHLPESAVFCHPSTVCLPYEEELVPL